MPNRYCILLVAMLGMACAASAQAGDKRFRHATRDTVIVTLQQDTFSFDKEAYNLLIDSFSALVYLEYPRHPDLLYYKVNLLTDVDYGKSSPVNFAGDAGQDNYYRLYAHFLAQRNGIAKYAALRTTLNALFVAINTLYSRLQCGGGTYYAHRQARVPGYAEYAVYQYSLYENNGAQRYPISPQKKHYIALLQQLIADEMAVDDDVVDCAASRKKELLELMDAIDRLTTDKFLLQQALAFQYATYVDD